MRLCAKILTISPPLGAQGLCPRTSIRGLLWMLVKYSLSPGQGYCHLTLVLDAFPSRWSLWRLQEEVKDACYEGIEGKLSLAIILIAAY